ncbi:capsid assembly protein [Pseudomonas phage gh-1]|uniref:Capsid assembly protein n=8 Tax=Ghunavirus TaxID=2732683 RepID=Q859E9_9CAUD|nr:head assembly [Pseudomonas phage gh-1]YP_009790520.1 head assembly [Pseudomonas phage KNP]QHB47905.1 capsid assembly protein [Pseudomonas phage CHF1]QHB47949.1 capsid assembly protein [Pseudomonas phage CHF7]QHB47997.1 capsid assembly protein [Pseudomonas phage CHF19]QHB48045.1 capsid assembly protein [Pseudomonas phage CHF21]QHB48093.1 capsid assembly protein [Pseudomonas phage CHF33]QHB48141.1 capsid assembly protein [Pseudomonas phage CHF17]QVD48970.1 capsid assembly protein [Pseudomo
MSDIYAEFGVNGAVMSSNNITEHEQNMLALPTSVRDGDESIETIDPETEVELGTEQDQETDVEVTDNEAGDGENDAAEEGSETEFTPLGEPDAELVESSRQIDEYAEGFSQMREQAIKAGLSAEVADQIEAEYERDNQLSEASLKALEAVGYSRGFVRSFINGQEALANTYVAQIQAYAGGPEKFQAILSHLNATSKDAVASLEKAIESQDLHAIKTIINLGMASHTKKFGKTPQRSVTKRAPASPAAARKSTVEGFASQREMIAAMSDKRYQDDASYRAQVEARVGASSW